MFWALQHTQLVFSLTAALASLLCQAAGEACTERHPWHVALCAASPMQAYILFRAELAAPYTFSAGAESLEVGLFEPDSIPFDEVRAHTGLSCWLQSADSDASHAFETHSSCCDLRPVVWHRCTIHDMRFRVVASYMPAQVAPVTFFWWGAAAAASAPARGYAQFHIE